MNSYYLRIVFLVKYFIRGFFKSITSKTQSCIHVKIYIRVDYICVNHSSFKSSANLRFKMKVNDEIANMICSCFSRYC